MIFALYREDPDGEIMDEEKIDKTIRELNRYPEKGTIYIFENEDGIIGYALVIFYWSNEFGGNLLNIDELYVYPTWRNKGIATKFFEFLFDIYERKVSGFCLEVTQSNRRALDYYKRIGFKEKDNINMIYQSVRDDLTNE